MEPFPIELKFFTVTKKGMRNSLTMVSKPEFHSKSSYGAKIVKNRASSDWAKILHSN